MLLDNQPQSVKHRPYYGFYRSVVQTILPQHNHIWSPTWNYHGQQGKWIEYYRNTGTPRVIQNFDKEEHKSLAKGKYKEFYTTGGKKTTGKYNSKRKQTGIWRSYFENGNKEKRARFINDREYGIVIIANDNWVKRNGKLKKKRYLYWNGKRLFHKSTRGYEKHF